MLEQVGEDYLIHKTTTSIDVGLVLSYFKHLWKNAIISDAQGVTNEIRKASYDNLFVQKEFVIYRDSGAVEQWDREGYSVDNSMTAVLVIIEADALCFTFNGSAAAQHIMNELSDVLTHNSTLRSLQTLPSLCRI